MELLEEEPALSAMPRLRLFFALASISAVLFCVAVRSCSVIHGGAPLRHRRSCSSAISSSTSPFLLVLFFCFCYLGPWSFVSGTLVHFSRSPFFMVVHFCCSSLNCWFFI
ncbi:uncharacterized protein DS421_14g469940 [Arachis hypogaea]|nr:uncharacterized protein DS421_14g469940 [Arachis hypogaea]